MRLSITKTKSAHRLYAIKSTYDPATQKNSSKIVAKFGTAEELMEEKHMSYDEVILWVKEEIARMDTASDAEKEKSISIALNPEKRLEKGCRRFVHTGYLFPKKILSELGVKKICNKISEKENFKYDLGEILETLVCGRIIEPRSKRATATWAKSLVEAPSFKEHQIYRALSVLAAHSDEIQASLYKASSKLTKRKDGVLYYDCTNFFFEINNEDIDGGLRQYGVSKEHRPNPIVQMGLFTDAQGIPLAFRMAPGNTNEQVTMRPLEQTIISDFEHAKFVVCTDSGLASCDNKMFNTKGGRAFICVQSIKKMPGYLKEWALDSTGWRMHNSKKTYNLNELAETAYMNDIFYKERWVPGKKGEADQRYIATFSFKYKEYLAEIRESQIERACARVNQGASSLERKRETDPMRLVDVAHITKDGEVCDKAVASINEKKIREEQRFDGFSCLVTTLEDNASEIIAVNKMRWQIEECFRIMKTEFKARPVYLNKGERIEAHFLCCFIALLVFRLLEKRLNMKDVTCEDILRTLRKMNMLELKGEGWMPCFEPNEITDALHSKFGFCTDYEIVTYRRMRTILAKSKSPKITI